MKIELNSFSVSIDRDGEDFIARICYRRIADRLTVGDSEQDVLDRVIVAVQNHIKDLTEDLQVIREARSGEKS